jgi:hypothetical protein
MPEIGRRNVLSEEGVVPSAGADQSIAAVSQRRDAFSRWA